MNDEILSDRLRDFKCKILFFTLMSSTAYGECNCIKKNKKLN